jgi:hypothetical protein
MNRIYGGSLLSDRTADSAESQEIRPPALASRGSLPGVMVVAFWGCPRVFEPFVEV